MKPLGTAADKQDFKENQAKTNVCRGRIVKTALGFSPQNGTA
jgi:hypothetical protein